MMDAAYIAYFEQLARQHPSLLHQPTEKRKSFFLIQNPLDLTEMDNAVRNNECARVLLLDIPTGYISDNTSANYTQHSKLDFFVLGKVSGGNNQWVSQDCFSIGIELIGQLRCDSMRQKIVKKPVYLQEEMIQYEPVGPIHVAHFGYSFSLQLCTSFSWKSKI